MHHEFYQKKQIFPPPWKILGPPLHTVYIKTKRFYTSFIMQLPSGGGVEVAAVWCRPGTKRAPIELKSSRNNKYRLIYVFGIFGSWPEKFPATVIVAVGGGPASGGKREVCVCV